MDRGKIEILNITLNISKRYGIKEIEKNSFLVLEGASVTHNFQSSKSRAYLPSCAL